MMIIVGLGNPGQKFEKTRHNLGFRVLDEFVREYNFPNFKFSKKFNSEISESFLVSKKIILAKPQTFMNNSGKAVKSLTLSLKPETLIVVHDDIDLPFSEFKIVQNRGAAGHKGVQSIIGALGTKDFVRFRIGILPENKESKSKNHKETEKFVLQKFAREEEKTIKQVIKKTIEAIDFSLKEGLEEAMNRYNK